MVSACNIEQAILDKWGEIKTSHARWMVLTCEGNDVKLESSGGLDTDFEAFKSALPADDARFGVFNLMWDSDDGRKMSKLLFITYVPDTCKVMAVKFTYAQNKDKVAGTFQPINKALQINDRLDLNETEWREMF